MLALAFANGTARAVGYQPLVGETAARQIATVTLLGLLGGYVWVLHRRAPLPDTGTAAAVGGTWAVLTLGFEFGFGHYVLGTSWAELLADYDLGRGRIWVLVPIATAISPALVRALQARRTER
jgi:apolipoprotein N-acyltransferase